MYDIEDQSIAQAMIDAVDASLLVLDEDLTVVAASRSYCNTFNVERADTEGRHIAELGGGEWNISELHEQLGAVQGQHRRLDAFEVNRDVADRGPRILRVGAREMTVQAHSLMLMEIIDITAERSAALDAKELAQRNEMLLEEMSHRFANSLMIIASILLMRAQTSRNEEARISLQDAHQRVVAIAAVQKQLRTFVETDEVQLGPYVTQLCDSLSSAMLDHPANIVLDVQIGDVTVSSGHAVHVGLLVTELVINAIKHGFPDWNSVGHVLVAYEGTVADWTLKVSDDGIGGPKPPSESKSGLGTLILEALAHRLNADVNVATSPGGRITSISHAA
jgi:two-component sensor histidine kinase